MKTIYNWIVTSSSDPEKTSLTLKAGAATIITFLTIVLGFAHVAVGSAELTQLSDSIIALVQALLLVVSAGMTVYGFLRKLYLTVTGQNAALNQ